MRPRGTCPAPGPSKGRRRADRRRSFWWACVGRLPVMRGNRRTADPNAIIPGSQPCRQHRNALFRQVRAGAGEHNGSAADCRRRARPGHEPAVERAARYQRDARAGRHQFEFLDRTRRTSGEGGGSRGAPGAPAKSLATPRCPNRQSGVRALCGVDRRRTEQLGALWRAGRRQPFDNTFTGTAPRKPRASTRMARACREWICLPRSTHLPTCSTCVSTTCFTAGWCGRVASAFTAPRGAARHRRSLDQDIAGARIVRRGGCRRGGRSEWDAVRLRSSSVR